MEENEKIELEKKKKLNEYNRIKREKFVKCFIKSTIAIAIICFVISLLFKIYIMDPFVKIAANSNVNKIERAFDFGKNFDEGDEERRTSLWWGQ